MRKDKHVVEALDSTRKQTLDPKILMENLRAWKVLYNHIVCDFVLIDHIERNLRCQVQDSVGGADEAIIVPSNSTWTDFIFCVADAMVLHRNMSLLPIDFLRSSNSTLFSLVKHTHLIELLRVPRMQQEHTFEKEFLY